MKSSPVFVNEINGKYRGAEIKPEEKKRNRRTVNRVWRPKTPQMEREKYIYITC